jgi:hypothetical protein
MHCGRRRGEILPPISAEQLTERSLALCKSFPMSSMNAAAIAKVYRELLLESLEAAGNSVPIDPCARRAIESAFDPEIPTTIPPHLARDSAMLPSLLRTEAGALLIRICEQLSLRRSEYVAAVAWAAQQDQAPNADAS